MKKLFGYKCKLSLALPYLAYKFIDNFKTKGNGFFYRMVSNTERIYKRFEEMNPQLLNQCFYVYRQENVTAVRSFARQNYNHWQQLIS